MALVLANRVRETCTSPGTGAVTLLGAVTGFQSFSIIGNGNTTYYTISDQSGSRWEVGIGTYTSSGTSLSRDVVLSSSSGTSLVNFNSGTQDVYVVYPSEKSVYTDASNNVSLPGSISATSLIDSGNLTFTGTGNRITGDFSNATIANRVAFQSSTTNGVTGVIALPNGTGVNSSYHAYNNSDTTNASGCNFGIVGSTDVRIQSFITGTGTYVPMTFYTGGSERVRVEAGGNVGIGTSSPIAKLSVSGSFNAATVGSYPSLTNVGSYGGGIGFYDTATSGLYAQDSGQTMQVFVGQAVTDTAASKVVMTYKASGNVGIGTSAPSSLLDVNGTVTATGWAGGGIVTETVTQTLTNKRVNPRVLASTANVAEPVLNTDDYDAMVITGQSVAITSFTTNLTGTPVNGQKLWISITGTTAIAITWGASFESSTITLPTTTVSTDRLDVGFVWNVATTKWRCVGAA